MTARGRHDVSRLGFGTAALGRSLGRRERVHVLETALACGITHIDTAPLYGAGAAERAVGLALRSATDTVTVATKVGIEPPGLGRLIAARAVGREPQARPSRFTPGEVRASFEASLRRLGRPHADLLLLHEIAPGEIDDALLATLQDAVARGDVRRLGIATGLRATEEILGLGLPFPEVVQIPDGAPFDVGERTLIVHSAIAGRTGTPGELLRAAADRHPTARLLFGSRRPAHVRETVASFASGGAAQGC